MKNIVKGKEMNIKDESFRDALIDTANYCVLTLVELDNQHIESAMNDEIYKYV